MQEGVDGRAMFNALESIDKRIGHTIEELRATVSSLDNFPNELYIGHSGGKDSVVIYWLMQCAFPGNYFPVVHTPKLSGPNKVHQETINFLYSRPFPIIHIPATSHASYGFKVQVDGSRRDEYNRTDGRSTTIVKDGKDVSRSEMTMLVNNGLFGLDFIYPIFDWSNEEVWACIHKMRLEVSPEYRKDV